MSCDLTIGRLEPCKNSVGGIKHVYFIDFKDVGSWAVAATDAVTGMSKADGVTTANAYKYELKGGNNLEQTITSSRENGTTFYETTLNLTLTFIDKLTQEELKLIAHARPHVFVEDYNGNYFVVGLEHGAEVTGGSIVSGAAMGDLSGFTLTMVAQETAPPYFITGSVVTGDASATQITPN